MVEAARKTKPHRRRQSRNLDKLLAFAFGVIFISVLLYLATVVQNPTPLAIRVYITVLALAAGGVGAILPGFLEIRHKNYIRAGGAIALSALVYLNEPAIGRAVIDFKLPDHPAEPLVERFLGAVDAGKLELAWDMLPDTARRHVAGSEEVFRQLLHNSVEPLGAVEARTLAGTSVLESPPGAPPGLYQVFSYRTKFSNDQGYRPEAVMVRANAAREWEMYSYQIGFEPS